MLAGPGRPSGGRSSGGRTLILLGLLLAVGAAAIVIFVVSQYTPSTASSVSVVVSKEDLPAGKVLSVDATDATHLLISDAFEVRQTSSDLVPPNAYVFTSQDALNAALNNQVVIGTFYAGEVLRAKDPRLAAIGSGAADSLTSINPAQLKPGDVIFAVQFSQAGIASGGANGKPWYVAGDHIDVVVTECNLRTDDQGHCETQTTLQNVYIYYAQADGIGVVLSHQDALTLKYLLETGKTTLVIRKPGDDAAVQTSAVDSGYIVKQFGY